MNNAKWWGKHMTVKKYIYYIVIIMVLLFSSASIVSAAGIEIRNIRHDLINEKSNEQAQFYTIFITVENTDDNPYENITIELLDDVIPVSDEHSFEPSEIKTFRFDDYPVAGGTTHQITVNVYPTDSSTRTPRNSDSTEFTLTYQDSTVDDTSFISLISILSMILFVGFIIARKKHR